MDERARLREPLSRRREVLKKRGLLYKYPRAISSVIIFSALGIFFSKPLYDAFIADPIGIDLSEPMITQQFMEEMRKKRMR